jgi:hypothetical protein
VALLIYALNQQRHEHQQVGCRFITPALLRSTQPAATIHWLRIDAVASSKEVTDDGTRRPATEGRDYGAGLLLRHDTEGTEAA